MQWTPGARPQEDRPRPYRGVLEAIQERARPFIEGRPEHERAAYQSVVRGGSEMLPGVGDVVGVEDLRSAAQDNDWGGIGLGLLAALPGIPAIGRGVRGEARAARRGLMTGAREAAPSGGLMTGGQTEAEAALARYRAANPDDTGARVLNPGDEGYPHNAQWDEASQAYVAPVEPDYPIRAFHGSPHSFDRFSLDKIGTGEGAQAYGHGLYFAESEGVARSYRDALTNKAVPPSAQTGLDKAAFNVVRSSVDGGLGLPDEQLASFVRQPYPDATDEEVFAAISNARQSLQPGSMYEVGINAHPDTFLDWDRPLSREQIETTFADYPRVLGGDAFQRRFLNKEDSGYTGSQAYGMASGWNRAADLSPDAARASEVSRALAERGVPGIRYLDGNSRGVGEGSSNYVVFNDELVKILRKYGISGLGMTAVGGGAAIAGRDQEYPGPTGL